VCVCVCVCLLRDFKHSLSVALVIGLADAESYTYSQGYVHLDVCVCVQMSAFVQDKLLFRLRRVRMSCEMATLHTDALLCGSVCVCVCVCVRGRICKSNKEACLSITVLLIV